MMITSIFNTTASRLGYIVRANISDAELFVEQSKYRYEEDFHTKTRNVTLYLFRMAFEQLRKGHVASANETVTTISSELIHRNYKRDPMFVIKHDYTKDYVIANTLEGLIQKVDYLQKLESKRNYIPQELWSDIVNVYTEIEHCLDSIYEDGFYNATKNIATAEKTFNDFTSMEQVRDINLFLNPYYRMNVA